MRSALTATVLIASAALVLPLAACNSGPSVSATNASTAEVQQKVAAATGGGGVMVQPGRWEGAVTIHEMDIPGMPPAARAQMKTQMGGAKSFVNCVTADDVKQQKALFTGDRSSNKNCKYDHFDLAGGKIDAAMSCDRGREGGKMTMTMTGSYAPDSYHIDMSSKSQEGGAPIGPVTMKMSVDAKRAGACRGSKDEL